jgi:hypothetical protein
MSNSTSAVPNDTIRGIRRIAVIAIIVSLSITALIGIFTLLSGDFGETQGKILGTTLLVAAFSITTLCHLAVVGRALRVVGYAGIAVSIVALITGALLIWSDWDDFELAGDMLRVFVAFSILAVSFAHANLLLLLGERKRPVIRIGLLVTVALIAVVAVLLIIPIATDGEVPGENGDNYWRVFGVFAILDVLGTVVLPVMSIFLRDEPAIASPSRLTIDLTAEQRNRLDAAAAARSVTPEQAVLDAIDAMPE